MSDVYTWIGVQRIIYETDYSKSEPTIIENLLDAL
jgi:hypothetical protein